MESIGGSSMLPRGASVEDFFFTGYRLLSGGEKEYVDQDYDEEDHNEHGSFGVHIEYEGACVACSSA